MSTTPSNMQSNTPNTDTVAQDVRCDALARWELLALAAAGAVLVLFRWHAFGLPLETDECNYAYIGKQLLAGDRLYVDLWDHQPFGVFALFAGVIALFGDDPIVFRILATVFSLTSLVLVFAITRRVAGASAAVVAGFLFAMVSADPGVAGEGCNREIYMNTFVLAAWYVALRGCADVVRGRRGEAWAVVLAGVLLGIGSTLKTILALHWIALLPWIVIRAGRSAGGAFDIRRAARLVLLFGLGPAVIWIGASGYFWWTDRFDVFFEAVFTFNLGYSGGDEPFFERFWQFLSPPRHPFVFESALALWIVGAAGVVWACVSGIHANRMHAGDTHRRATSIAIALLGLAGFLAICLPGQFWPHYYYLLLPTLAIAAATAIAQIASAIASLVGVSRGVHVTVRTVAYAILVLLTLATEYRHYLSQPLERITIKRYNSRDFWGRAHGENVRRVTEPGDSVFVFGNDTGIYYYSQRRCASRFTMITGLQAQYQGVAARRAILLEELERSLPRVIIVLFDEQPFDGWLALLERYYGEAVGVDYHDRTGKAIMLVFARKDQPIESIDWDWTHGAAREGS